MADNPIEKLESTVVELQIETSRINEQVKSINTKVDNIHSDVKDIHKYMLGEKSATNRRLWTWVRVLLFFILGGGVASGAIQMLTDNPAEANPTTQEQSK